MTERTTIKHRSSCPLASALDIFGDKWTLLVIRDLIYFGPSSFNKLSSSAENMPTNTLADRLKRLVALDIVSKELYQERPKRYAYHLTEKGLSLIPVMKAMTLWGQEHVENTETIVAIKDGEEVMTRPVSVDVSLLAD